MVDRITLNAVIIDWGTHTPEEIAACTEHLVGEPWSLYMWRLDESSGTPTIALGESFGANEYPVGSAEELAADLIQRIPNATWRVWEDPKYEWLGSLFAHVPDHGVFTADCNSEGTPVFTSEHIRKAVADGDLDTLLGTAWGL